MSKQGAGQQLQSAGEKGNEGLAEKNPILDKDEQIHSLKKKMRVLKQAIISERELRAQLDKRALELDAKNQALTKELDEREQTHQKLRRELTVITERLMDQRGQDKNVSQQENQ